MISLMALLDLIHFPLPYGIASTWPVGWRLVILWFAALVGYLLFRKLCRCLRKWLRDPMVLAGIAAILCSGGYEVTRAYIIPTVSNIDYPFSAEYTVIALLLLTIVGLLLYIFSQPLASKAITIALTTGGRLLGSLWRLCHERKDDKKQDKTEGTTTVITPIYNVSPIMDQASVIQLATQQQQDFSQLVQNLTQQQQSMAQQIQGIAAQITQLLEHHPPTYPYVEAATTTIELPDPRSSHDHWTLIPGQPRNTQQRPSPAPFPTANPFQALAQEGGGDENEDDLTIPTATALPLAMAQQRQIKKQPPKRVNPRATTQQTTLTAQHQQLNMGDGIKELLVKYGVPNEKALTEVLQQRQRAEREAAKEPQYLTEEEKGFDTFEELFRFWKTKDQQRRVQMRPFTAFDYYSLGQLTPAHKALPRSELRRMVAQLRHDKWIADRVDRGQPLYQCPHCQRITGEGHKCHALKWTTGGPGPLDTRQLLLTEENKRITIQPAPGPSLQSLQEVYEASQAQLAERARVQQLLTPDVTMTDNVNPTPEIRVPQPTTQPAATPTTLPTISITPPNTTTNTISRIPFVGQPPFRLAHAHAEPPP